MKTLLEAKNITKTFPLGDGSKIHAVERVSFSLGQAETLAVVGESGCGKSTLAQLVCRLLQPTSGDVLLNGHDVTQLSTKALKPYRRQMQMIFHDPFASVGSTALSAKAKNCGRSLVTCSKGSASNVVTWNNFRTSSLVGNGSVSVLRAP